MIAVFLHHIMILPVVLPLITGALLLFINDRKRFLKSVLAFVSSGLTVFIAAILVYRARDLAPFADVYNLGNWPVPFGIVFVLDKLSAVFLLMAALISLCALVYATAYWHKVGAHLYSFGQFFLVGVNGALLTGDLFNLFVFFEIMLTASYALLMHGSGLIRVQAGMHYVTINLMASFCFLIGTAMLYGGTGTLNMADLASALGKIKGDDLLISQIGMGILGIAILIKAAMWPLCFWAPAAYGSAAAPIGALFSITGKVGLFIILRLSILLLQNDKTGMQDAVCQILFYGGLVTILFGFTGVLSAQTLTRLCANSVIVSAGTVLAAFGLNTPALTGVIVYYILSSTFSLAALFLLAEPIDRGQDAVDRVLAITMEVYGEDEEEEEEEIGFYIPATLAVLGACFAICSILLIGLPPLSGFIAKFMMLTSVFYPQGQENAMHFPNIEAWLFIIILVVSGFSQLIAMTRIGIRIFWSPLAAEVPKVQITEILPIAALLSFCCLLTILAGPVMNYMNSMAAELRVPNNYIHSVLDNTVKMKE